MGNRLIIAAAGSGKTTYLVNEALKQNQTVLITTYTEANEREIHKKFIQQIGYVPNNVTIQTWDSFLLQHGVRPFQGIILEDSINGMLLVNEKSGKKYIGKYGPVYYGENDYKKHYFSNSMKIFSDKIAKFVCKCEEKTKGKVFQRINRLFSTVYIDEVQDLAGYDLEIIKILMKTNNNIIMVGDPRQVTYYTHHELKHKKYINGKIEEFIINECKSVDCSIDKETLNNSYRNNKAICYYSSKLYSDLGETGTNQFEVTGHDGVFLVHSKNVDEYLNEFNPVQLRYSKSTPVNNSYSSFNMGESKGSTFKRVLIYPTDKMKKWILNNSFELQPETKAKFYVALTRAKYSVGIVFDYDDKTNIDGVLKYNNYKKCIGFRK